MWPDTLQMKRFERPPCEAMKVEPRSQTEAARTEMLQVWGERKDRLCGLQEAEVEGRGYPRLLEPK